MKRRNFLQHSTGAALAASLTTNAAQAASLPPSKLGVSIASYMIRSRHSHKPGDHPKFPDTLSFLTHCHEALNAGGIQAGVSGWGENNLAKSLRTKAEEWNMYLEGQIRLPKDKTDLARFDREVAQAKETGVTILRTVMLSGRRYETFKSLGSWEAFRQRSWHSVTLAEPVVAKHQVKLAIENHKDWRVEEMLAILERLSSEHVGVNLDTGNNIALLEDPHEVVETLAPHSFTTHLKDMGVETDPNGFLLAEVPLGQGYLDIPKIIETCRRANPSIRFNLEMITRDPLRIPCYRDDFWITFGDLPARELAQCLRQVHANPSSDPLPRVGDLDLPQQIEIEEQHNRQSFTWARNHGV